MEPAPRMGKIKNNMARPEHNKASIPFIEKLKALGWSSDQIVYDHEWRTPKAPHDALKRDAGQRFDSWPVDIAVFDDSKHSGDHRHLSLLIETQAPNHKEGRAQLEIYFKCEPHAKCGIWTNGSDTCVIYRTADGSFVEDKKALIPKPTDSLIFAAAKRTVFSDLNLPTAQDLRKKFARLLQIVVARDTRSTRRDDQLNELCNLLLTKLESDKIASLDPSKEVVFQVQNTEAQTVRNIQTLFSDLRVSHNDLFGQEPYSRINLDDHTITVAAYELGMMRLKDNTAHVIAEAFQVFRAAALKSKEGQYFTPYPVIRSVVRFLEIRAEDNVLDPACGTGGFLIESYQQLRELNPNITAEDAAAWANQHLFGIDKDRINVKLTRAVMLIVGDGSTNTYIGNSLRTSQWPAAFPELVETCPDKGYSLIITNPPFGVDLTLAPSEARTEQYQICQKPLKRNSSTSTFANTYEEREIGIVFIERCWRFLREGGVLGVILPETYFFSASYRWFQGWIHSQFDLVGMLNIPMEAFQGFCRAKTNFYVLRKKGGTPRLMAWEKPGFVCSINATTCGLNKDGEEQMKVDQLTGQYLDEVDDELWTAVNSGSSGKKTTGCHDYIKTTLVKTSEIAVPCYFDQNSQQAFHNFIVQHREKFKVLSIGAAIKEGLIEVRGGHGSPSEDQRVGAIPYIKVSDLRAGLVNINPTNLTPLDLARKFWKTKDSPGDTSKITSGLCEYDLISPERASKNIGEFCVLMPGQENVILTKEVIIIRPSATANFDRFYLMWALSLSCVRSQWRRVIFMQTNREDVGNRYHEILVPFPVSKEIGNAFGTPFQQYFTSLQDARKKLSASLKQQGTKHHIFFA